MQLVSWFCMSKTVSGFVSWITTGSVVFSNITGRSVSCDRRRECVQYDHHKDYVPKYK
jgi:hypothetical protein